MSHWRLLLTRPAEECAALAATLAEQGIYSSSLPLLAIEALAETPEQRATILDLERYCAVIVVSKPAARLGLELLDRYWPQPLAEQPWFSVGAATAEILGDYGLTVHFPALADDSEALLGLPQLQQAVAAAQTPRVLILRGEEGREFLAESLRSQGVQVDYLALYRRQLPEYPAQTLPERVQAERLNGLVVSSGQGLSHLLQLAGEHWPALARLPLFVPRHMPRALRLLWIVAVQAPRRCWRRCRCNLPPTSDAKDGYVSEATTPKEQEQPVVDTPTSTAPDTAAKPARGNGLALLALLLGAAGVAVGGWGVWQLRGLEAREQLQLSQLQEVRSQTESVARGEQRLSARLQQLPTADELEARERLVAQLQGDQQLLNQRLETVLGASRQDWRLAEAEHLLRLASLRLSALQDINSATALVQGADEILRDQDDPAAFAAREQLAKSLEALRSTPNPDRTGLFLQLGALREQLEHLNALNPVFQSQGGVLSDLAAEGDGGSWWADWLETLSQYIRLDFSADQNIRPLLAGQSLTQVRLALSLALEQAQWAALHGQTQVYQQALKQAREVLGAHFNLDNPNSRALRARIAEIIDQPIEVVAPDLSQSLNAVQAYVQHKQSAREGLENNAPAEAAPSAEEGRP